jgi:toxin ParE1/3/4
VRIVWSRRAVQHLEAIRSYIAKDHPHIGRAGRVIGTRELVVSGTPYVIPYRVKEDRLELIAVFHDKQKWPERL